MIFFFLFFTLTAFTATESTDAFEKSYPRDNTFCHFNNQTVEIIIRGNSKFIEPKEKGYGEHIFYRREGIKAKLLKINQAHEHTYRLFTGTSPLCSKSHGYLVDPTTMAILLLKENRPFDGKLVIQLVDLKTMVPTKAIETDFPTDKAIPAEGGFSFKTIPENFSPEMGRVMIEETQFIFQERTFPLWMEFTGMKISINPENTFDHFPFKSHFKDQADFLSLTGWNSTEKKFEKSFMYLAVNHKIKKQCLLFIAKKQKLAGQETWRCHAM